MADKTPSIHFMSLVFSLSQAAMQQMGKITNPLTGKIEKNLQQAELTIDMLNMLRDKTEGNLVKEEDRLIKDTIANLQLNFVEEKKKKEDTQEQPKEKKEESEEKKEDSKEK